MNMGHTHEDYPIHPAGHHTPGRRQARLRHLLGIVLIVVGSIWLCLRLTGVVGDLPLPIRLALSVPLAACGMLALYGNRRDR